MRASPVRGILGRVALGALIAIVLRSEGLCQDPEEVRAILEKLAPGQSAKIGPVTFTMNQRQAGVPDKQGWYPARSTRGGFTVRMPIPYNDFSMVSAATDGATNVSDTIGGRSAEGSRFLVNCIRRSDGKVPDDWAVGVAASLAAGEPSARRQAVHRPGLTGVALEIRNPSRGLFLAQLLTGHGSMCQVSVEHPRLDDRALEDTAKVFLASFALTPVGGP